MRPPGYLSRYCNGSGEMERRAGLSGCREKEVVSVETVSLSAVDQQQKNSVVRIVLAGGMVEMYGGAVSAQLVMEKYPGLCLAKPDVFQRPHESVVSPRARLLPGQKFYLVPRSTLIKLRRNVSREDKQLENRLLHEEDIDCRDDDYSICSAKDFYDSICSAKDFYASKENWVECFMKKLENAKEMQERSMEMPNFIPRSKKLRPRIGLLGGWQPSLSPVQELSP
ncbi:uncharacterized protein LOC122038776 [Zingiber officinale]|uniref:Uncharacterized protein n=1 Tax=Zingiber officinale TaxID=94328 RepID=A0A8J5IB72_ZINOF|nr:uncharacterized protein LOC122038776 [Zingiber officinale]KAG6532245.1 hypothetical protein ZIOFF_006084 [Zingiber officinale]